MRMIVPNSLLTTACAKGDLTPVPPVAILQAQNFTNLGIVNKEKKPMTSKEKTNSNKMTARIVGVLYIIGTVTGILSLVFGGTIIDDPDYLVKVSENENQFIAGALLVLTMGLALAMVPVMMFPILKKHNQVLALGYVVFRGALETVAYFGTVIGWLLLIPLSQEYVKAGASDAPYFQTLGALVLKVTDSSDYITTLVFSLGALMFSYVLYQSKLIPRWLSGWGFIGAILVLAVGLLAMFGVDLEVLWAPLALQEMVMAVWLIVKGFNSSAIASESAK
jgi:hypothetical protein